MPFVPVRSSRLTVSAAFCLAALPTFAQEPAPATPPALSQFSPAEQAVLASAQNKSEIMANLQYLCDRIGPRLTGSERLRRANQWTAEKMRAYGLENVRLEPYTIPIGWERGPLSFKLQDDQGGMSLSAAQMAWTDATRGKISGPVVVVRVETEADLAQYRGKLKNAVVLQNPPSQVQRVISARGQNGEALASSAPSPYVSYGTLPAPPPRGAARNAAAAPPAGPRLTRAQARALRQKIGQFFKDEGVAALLTDSGKPHGLLNMTGSWSGMGTFKNNKPERTPLTTLFVAHDHYALLYRLAEQARLGQGPAPRVELEAKSRFIKGPVTVYNTVGEVRGTDKADEFVVLGAHLDSWDLAQGTTDNGTGSSVVLEAARLLGEAARAGQRPRRTIRFALFSGEEEGLHGANAYVAAHKAELPKHTAAFVHDTGTGRVTGFGLEGRTNLRATLTPQIAGFADFGFIGIDDGGIGPSTDHYPFHSAGVPGFAFLQDPAEYRLTHHTNSDTLDKARPADLIQGASIMTILAWRVGNLPDQLPKEVPATASSAPRLPATGAYLDEDLHGHAHEGDE